MNALILAGSIEECHFYRNKIEAERKICLTSYERMLGLSPDKWKVVVCGTADLRKDYPDIKDAIISRKFEIEYLW